MDSAGAIGYAPSPASIPTPASEPVTSKHHDVSSLDPVDRRTPVADSEAS
jgi:hypothetical protein